MAKYIDIEWLKNKKRFDSRQQRYIVRMTDIYSAPSIDGIVRCAECAYCNVQNTKYMYAICERHGIEFKPFEDDTRTHYCAWGVKAEQTEPQTESLEQFRVGLEYHTDTTHFGKTKGESVTTNKIDGRATDGKE